MKSRMGMTAPAATLALCLPAKAALLDMTFSELALNAILSINGHDVSFDIAGRPNW